jgi:GST-like protein
MAQRAGALKNQHSFKTELDADVRKFMFPQNGRLVKNA